MNYTVTTQACDDARDVGTLLGAYIFSGLNLQQMMSTIESSWDEVDIEGRTYSVSPQATQCMIVFVPILIRWQQQMPFDVRRLCLDCIEQLVAGLHGFGSVTLEPSSQRSGMVSIVTRDYSYPTFSIAAFMGLAALGITSFDPKRLNSESLHLTLA